MNNPIALRIVFFGFFIFLYLSLAGKTYANPKQYVSNNTWDVYDSEPSSNSQAIFFGNAEEVNWPGTNTYPGILPEAKWIWAPGIANSNSVSDLTQYYFSKKIFIPNNVSNYSGYIILVVDDLAEVFINNISVGSHGSIDDVNLSGNFTKKIYFNHLLHNGENTISIRVQNGPSSFSGTNCINCKWEQNPAGVLFSIEIDSGNIQLPVPSLFQTSEPWQGQTYDGANSWSPSAKTIKDWGCALTAYTMILKYFGINKLPNGTILDPGTLNIWLKNNNGYIDGKSSGYINPIAISVLSKKAKQINNITTFDALEYSRILGNNLLTLIDSIQNEIPVILDVGGHFVVAKGINGNTFDINDPYYQNRNDLTAYNNTFNYFNKLSPSNTDLSYIMITGDQNLEINLTNSHGDIIGEEYLQEPLINEETTKSSGKPIKVILFPKPENDSYSLNILGNNEKGSFQIFLYDENGNLELSKYTINTKKNKSYNLRITFNKNNSRKNKIKHKHVNMYNEFKEELKN